ncbi:MAG: hypothetical protein QOH76_1886 [Thermoleophilaceae bacterium]|jgi:hypothetical protein|nr:hypothetical protein [Thermoleophilaceae bacterium]
MTQVANTREEWQKLLRSDAQLVRSADDWKKLVSNRERRAELLHKCPDQAVAKFTELLVFRNGGLAGADYSVLTTHLSADQITGVFTAFGIGPELSQSYDAYYCKSAGTCSSQAKCICTDNC